MSDSVVLKSIHIRNVLSFGDGIEPLRLGPLNVLVGPNGAGKSNILEIIGILKSTPRDIGASFRNGGVESWMWRGGGEYAIASVNASLAPVWTSDKPLTYTLDIQAHGLFQRIVREVIKDDDGSSPSAANSYFWTLGDKASLKLGGEPTLLGEQYDSMQSILAQRKDPALYPEVTYLGRLFESFRLYRDWRMGPGSPARRAQGADLQNNYLDEDCSNLGMVLNNMRQSGQLWRRFKEQLAAFYEDAEDIEIQVIGGTVQIALRERLFDSTIPAPRLSDGTLRWIALLAILLHPSPPPLVCIEEPEIGLHLDMMPTLAKLLQEASERMQLIVTTHSDALVDALSDTPEAIIVCEKEDGATTMRRLSREDLGARLEKYSLGQLWTRGEIGGNRW
jgi:predicted ATPase